MGKSKGKYQPAPYKAPCTITKYQAPQKTHSVRVNTSSMSPGMSLIKGGKLNVPEQPEVWYTAEVDAQMTYLVDKCAKEVGWFGLVRYLEAENAYEIYKLVIPEQTVTSTETDISGEAWGVATHKLIQEGYEPGHMCAWFHSHVNMPVSPSTQDEDQIEEFIAGLLDVPEIPVFIRGIVNKKGEEKVDVYYIQESLAFTCVDTFIYDDRKTTFTQGMDELIKNNIKQPTYTNSSYQAGTSFQTYYDRSSAPVKQNYQHQQGQQTFDYYDEEEDDYYSSPVVPDPDVSAAQALVKKGWELWEESLFDLADDVWDEQQQLFEMHMRDKDSYGGGWDEDASINERPIGWQTDAAYAMWGADLDDLAP